MNWRGKIEAFPVTGSALLGLIYVLAFTDIRDPLVIIIWALILIRGLAGLFRKES